MISIFEFSVEETSFLPDSVFIVSFRIASELQNKEV